MALAEFENLSGSSFELVLMQQLAGAGPENVRGTPATGDQGADVLFEFAGRRVAVQAKRYAGNVGNKAVQEAHAAKGFYECDEAWVVTNSDFTTSALQLASQLGVTLIRARTYSGLSRFSAGTSSREDVRGSSRVAGQGPLRSP